MKILHYSLGFPPYRTGGLTKFCMDVMYQQKKIGHEVAMIWPGEMKVINKSVKIKNRINNSEIKSFEIVNPLPISYDEGIVNVEKFCKKCDSGVFLRFLNSYEPDIIHVHTLMGLHREFIETARKLGIRTVFTVHDFFPICPKVTMFRNGSICLNADTCSECPKCNMTALSLNKITILQSPLYRVVKNNLLVKKLRKTHRDNYLGECEKQKKINNLHIGNASLAYKKLRSYYGSIISIFDSIHYNSSITKIIFEKFFFTQSSHIISISHGDIVDKRKEKLFSEVLHITYLGPQSSAKGFFLLKNALDELWEKSKLFVLNIYFEPNEIAPYMITHRRYEYSELEEIFDNTDILIVPSIWYETFGFTVLEALSHGVPVIISENVGAKDIVIDGCGIVIHNIDSQNLMKVIENITLFDLKEMNQKIINNAIITSLDEMTKEIMDICY